MVADDTTRIRSSALGMRPNRRPAGDDDYITKHHVVTTLRARVRGLARYYRRSQKEEDRVVTTVTRWARKETRAAVGALRLVKPKAHTSVLSKPSSDK